MSEEEIKGLQEHTDIIINEGLDSEDDIQGILKKWEELYNKEKAKNKELENADLTTVYINGFYDGEKKWKDKIKNKFEDYSQSSLMENNTFLDFKNDLLEEDNK